jgi:hypothetical protein
VAVRSASAPCQLRVTSFASNFCLLDRHPIYVPTRAAPHVYASHYGPRLAHDSKEYGHGPKNHKRLARSRRVGKRDRLLRGSGTGEWDVQTSSLPLWCWGGGVGRALGVGGGQGALRVGGVGPGHRVWVPCAWGCAACWALGYRVSADLRYAPPATPGGMPLPAPAGSPRYASPRSDAAARSGFFPSSQVTTFRAIYAMTSHVRTWPSISRGEYSPPA